MSEQKETETIPVRPGEDFDRERLSGYLREHLEDLPGGSLEVRQFPAGASNLTYLLRIGDWEAVLRRPPLGPLPPKAHDMEREATLLKKLHPVFPLAPKPYLLCTEPGVLGAVFYVMERRKGVVLDGDFPAGVDVTEDLCRRISETVVETLVRLHAIDWREAGLESFGRPEGFLKRQVEGWIRRYDKAKTDDIPQVELLTRWLTGHIPQSPAATVIHNDFKLNNMLLDPSDLSSPTAVVDWEMTTIGDPLFDLAVSLSYWVQPDDPAELRDILPSVTGRYGFISRERFLELYAAKSGRDLSSMHFYMTFAYFKLAVIIQQIYARWKKGQTRDPRFASFGERVRGLIRYAAQFAKAGRI
ncbi:aminoglycoside phosphotransferase (APT) family kinase protein [Melghirimyces profundicolus]|uniref:Aminoglycoside phosphotransferase (APT) family kinase protein n=1 Tax=Melghirimyces profundicolus TaxID=1242148 RepID=A0A2T6BGG7_9BACL|nr:phosphotransferase family protein [Melghirimyces profundicolus]PTX55146.1 aminoglycoside phosphotransferase (APT) family kinase protein [Melghirimyces profundicolus]